MDYQIFIDFNLVNSKIVLIYDYKKVLNKIDLKFLYKLYL